MDFFTVRPRKSRHLKYLSTVTVMVIFGVAFLLLFFRPTAEKTGTANPVSIAVNKVSSLSCKVKLGASQKVGIQAGHYQIDQLPDELTNLRYDFGASFNGVNEVDVNLNIARKTVAILQSYGLKADLLPATIPSGYCASAFVAIHADGNDVTSVYGYKDVPSAFDTNGTAQKLSDSIQKAYGQATKMTLNPTISDNMTQYYAFNYSKFVHAISPETPGVLIEIGFLSNATDRSRMLNSPGVLAQGIATGVIVFLNSKVATN